MTVEEWQGVEDTPKTQWLNMKKRHEEELTKLEIEKARALIAILGRHMAERDQLRKGNQ